MTAHFDDYERIPQLLLGVVLQHVVKLVMAIRQSLERDSEIDDATPQPVEEDQPPKVPIAGNEDTAEFACATQEISVRRPRATELGRSHDIMAILAEKPLRSEIDVLIEEELHTVAASLISSVSARAIA